MPNIDLTGQRFGKLIVVEKTDGRHNGSVVYKCKCDCGNYKNIPSPYLKKGHAKSCGCFDKNDLTGQVFGRLIVIEEAGRDKFNQKLWLCKCECDGLIKTTTQRLKSGKTKSCGCLNTESRMNQIVKTNKIIAENYLIDNTNITQLKRKRNINNNSGVKGVSWHKKANRWIANITLNKERVYLGLFDTVEDAAQARKEAEDKYFKPILEKYEKR